MARDLALGRRRGALDADAAIDRDLIVQQLEADRFADTELREETWDPLAWVYLLGEGLFPLIARDFAPLADRLASVAGRLEGMPAVLEAAPRARSSDRRRTGRSARLQTETAIDQLPGSPTRRRCAGEADRAAAPDDPAVAALRPRLEAAAAAANGALARFEAHLRDVVLPASDGDGAPGPPTCSPARCSTRCARRS